MGRTTAFRKLEKKQSWSHKCRAYCSGHSLKSWMDLYDNFNYVRYLLNEKRQHCTNITPRAFKKLEQKQFESHKYRTCCDGHRKESHEWINMTTLTCKIFVAPRKSTLCKYFSRWWKLKIRKSISNAKDVDKTTWNNGKRIDIIILKHYFIILNYPW